MKKLILLFILLPVTAFSQLYTNPFLSRSLPEKPVETKKGILRVDIYGGSLIHSNSLNNKLYYNYATKNFISEEAKASPLLMIRENIRLGWYSNFNTYVNWASGQAGLSFFGGLQARQQVGATGPGALYRLGLFGNSGFENETVPLAPTRFLRYYYQNLNAGFIKEGYDQEKNRGWMFGAGLSLVKGSGLNDLDVNNGFLYTAPYGDSISVAVEGTYSRTNSTANLTTIGGWGGAINAFFGIRLNKSSTLYASVNDLGLISWNADKTLENKFNASYQFNGVDVWFDDEGNANYSSGMNVLDSLTNSLESGKQNKAVVTMMPAQFQLLYNLQLTRSWGMVIGSEYFLRSAHLPAIHVSGKYYFNPQTAIATGFQLLGYGEYGILLRGEVRITDKVRMVLGTDHLEAVFSSSQTKGTGLYGRLTYIMSK